MCPEVADQRGTPCLRRLAHGHGSLSKDMHQKNSMAHAPVKRVCGMRDKGGWPKDHRVSAKAAPPATGRASLPSP